MKEDNIQSESKPTVEQIGTPVKLGVANGIKPCPLCNGMEGEDVFLGYQEPIYMITCIPCGLKIIDDRKDKVQAKWNTRNGKGFWDEPPSVQPILFQSASIEMVAQRFADEDDWADDINIHGSLKSGFIAGAQWQQLNSQQQVDILKKALETIIGFNRQQALDQYGNAEKAETWACIKVAREAINKSHYQ